jgi:HAD superfamily hydrolase (TIGR01509 family)
MPRIHNPFPRRVEAVILDLDGTLLDTENVYVTSFDEAATAMGHALPPGFLHGLIGLPGPEFRARMEAELGQDFPFAEHRRRYMILRDRMMANGVPIKPGAVDFLDALARAAMPMAIATAATRENAEANLRAAGLRERFKIMFTREDVEHSKPRPDLFLRAAAAIGIAPSSCAAVEDSHNGVRAAHAADMMTVMVPDIVPATPEITALCVAIAKNLHEVRHMVLPAGA